MTSHVHICMCVSMHTCICMVIICVQYNLLSVATQVLTEKWLLKAGDHSK